MEYLQIGQYLAAIFSVVGAAFVYVFVRPLNKSIDRVEAAVTKLTEELHISREQQHRMEGEIREMKYAIQKAHDRIDAFLKEQAHHVGKN
ncbi:MAG: hypothetical protein IKN27_06750 [Selenomonadaceae bacterium]|nr:hypothetical protein [Selenomonadaceae bacterium]